MFREVFNGSVGQWRPDQGGGVQRRWHSLAEHALLEKKVPGGQVQTGKLYLLIRQMDVPGQNTFWHLRAADGDGDGTPEGGPLTS